MEKERINRREFIKSTAALAGAVMVSSSSCKEENVENVNTKKTAIDQVELGKTGMKLSRLGIGTGTISGTVQRNLGTKAFNNLIKHAYDQGITFIDNAESYQTRPMIADAIKGLPREKLFIQSKIETHGLQNSIFSSGRTRTETSNNLEKIEGFLKEYKVDYIDSLLVHCQASPTWDDDNKRLLEDLTKAKEKGYIRSHGVSCHSLPATTKAASLDWVEVNLVRINPQGVNVDTASTDIFAQSRKSDVSRIVEQMKIMRQNGHGIIGMKLIGQGVFTDIKERKKSLTWVIQQDIVDAVIVGVKSKEEIDEAIKHINEAFAEKA